MDALFDIAEVSDVEHAVTAHFRVSGEDYGEPDERAVLFSAERALSVAIADAGVGEMDGNEFGGGQAVLYAYGPDADALFKVMEPTLRAPPFRPAHVLLRYAPRLRARWSRWSPPKSARELCGVGGSMRASCRMSTTTSFTRGAPLRLSPEGGSA